MSTQDGDVNKGRWAKKIFPPLKVKGNLYVYMFSRWLMDDRSCSDGAAFRPLCERPL